MSTRCPACNYVRAPTDQAPEWQCPACKKAYGKVGVNTAPAETPREPPAAIDADARGAPVFESLVICALVAMLRQFKAGMGMETTLMLVPLFLSVMPALALTGRWRTYVTRKWQWGLARVEDESGPAMTRLVQVCSALFAVVFTGFIMIFSR